MSNLKAAQSKSYIWLYRTSGEAEKQIVLYDYQPDRKHNRPKEFLEKFSGYLHTDGYEAYHKLPYSTALPEKVYVPMPKKGPEKYAWEEEEK